MIGIEPKNLLSQVALSAPFLFGPEFKDSDAFFIKKLRYYKKNPKLLKNLNLLQYFEICLCSHWATAGSFCPTDVDSLIRLKLWKEEKVSRYLSDMVNLVIESLSWDYSGVSQRSCKRIKIATHEGTWFSVAVGAYCACLKLKRDDLAEEVYQTILTEVNRERSIIQRLIERQSYLELIEVAPLIAHNLGDLNRVFLAWNIDTSSQKIQAIYEQNLKDETFKLNAILNKHFTASENHRHLSLRASKALRESSRYLMQVPPLLDDWGILIAESSLSSEKIIEIIGCLFDGTEREKSAIGYLRAISAITESRGLKNLEAHASYDLITKLKNLHVPPRAHFEREISEKCAEIVNNRYGIT